MVNRERVIAYIDGFNLYFGMKQKGWNDVLWLDLELMVKNLLKSHQLLEACNYFTSRVKNNPTKEARQRNYLDALLQHTSVKIHYGHFLANTLNCRKCGHSYPTANEKMTDVNIATQLLTDAFKDYFDTALLVTGDSDLVPPVNALHSLFPEKKVIVAFPPDRFGVTLKTAAKASFMIGRATLKNSQLPETITKPNGHVLSRPSAWE